MFRFLFFVALVAGAGLSIELCLAALYPTDTGIRNVSYFIFGWLAAVWYYTQTVE